jgi:thiamine kinase-like enzyme
VGACHGDLVVDNVIVDKDQIHYIDHRPGIVNDIFYDICKFYHSLQLHNRNLENYHLTQDKDEYIIKMSPSDEDSIRLNQFQLSPIYHQHKRKIELGVGCIWLSMSPLNVDKDLNKFLFLLGIEQLKKYE